MLILTRKINESIIINDDVVITVIDIRGDKIRLGIAAPKEIAVHRQEIYDRIQDQKKLEGDSNGSHSPDGSC